MKKFLGFLISLIILAMPEMAFASVQTDYIHNQINQFRTSHGTYATKTNSQTCNFAAKRAKEISTNFSHNGFNTTTLRNAYGSYHYVTENIAMTSSYKNVVNMWINSAGHRKNLLANTPYICVGIYNNYYAMEGWRP